MVGVAAKGPRMVGSHQLPVPGRNFPLLFTPLVQMHRPHLRFPRRLSSGNMCGGFRVQGSGFKVQGSGSRVQGSGFSVQGSGLVDSGLEFRVKG